KKAGGLLVCLGSWVLGCSFLSADDQDRLQVGVQPDGRIVVPTNQVLKPAGTQVTFPGRPVDLAWVDEQTVVLKSMRELVFIDLTTAQVKQTLALPSRGKPRPGFSVVSLAVLNGRIFASDAHDQVRVAQRQPDGSYQWASALPIPPPKVEGHAHP